MKRILYATLLWALLAGCVPAASMPTASPAPTRRPSPTLIPSQTPTAAVLPDALGFRGARIWPGDGSAYHIMGEVVNQSAHPLAQIEVTGRLADSLGQTLAEGHTGLDIALLLPGQAAPFHLTLRGESSAVAYNYHLQASGEGVAGPLPVTDALELVSALQSDAGALRFDGTITNQSQYVLDAVTVVIVLYVEDDEVGGMGAVTVEGRLAPGEMTSFSRTLGSDEMAAGMAPDGIAGYWLVAEGRLADAANAR